MEQSTSFTVNEFVSELLSLQQDGSRAISAPANWQEPPLLEVQAPVDDRAEQLLKQMLRGDGEHHGAWHFFIGAPGNGKSAAAGKLYRKLREMGHFIVTERGIPLDELEESRVPYVVHVRENSNAYATAWLAQDASVVRDPFADDVNPSGDLLRLLQNAWEAGVSLLVCTNRGVLEKAYRSVQLDADTNQLPWAKCLRHAALNEDAIERLPFSERPRRPFDTFTFSYTYVDKQSLLIGSDLFERLLQRAVDIERWEDCSSCSVRQHCPFRTNRDYLASSEGAATLAKLLSRAELLSGQVIVFREAVALISFLLAGCPRDYATSAPCGWVHERAQLGDYFTLLARRFYISLLSAYSPYGLETDPTLNSEQLGDLKSISEELEAAAPVSALALNGVVASDDGLSTDVGLTRLLGPNGVLCSLDLVRGAPGGDFYSRWDAPPGDILSIASPALSPLERQCCEIWSDIEKHVEQSPIETVRRFIHVRRWVTAFAFRLGAFIDDRFTFATELDEVLAIVKFRGESLSPRQSRELKRMEEQLQDIMRTEAGDTIELSEVVRLGGEWSRTSLRPRVRLDSRATHPGLAITFGEATEVILDTAILVWLKLRARHHLDLVSFPTHLLQASVDSQVEAAGESGYAFQDDDVELRIIDPEGYARVLERIAGEVSIEYERSDSA